MIGRKIDNKIKAALGCVLLFTATAYGQQSEEFVLQGQMPQAFTGKVYLTYVEAEKGRTTVDSLTLNGADHFTFKGVLPHTDNYRIFTSPHKYSATFMLQPSSHYRVKLAERGEGMVEVISGGEEQKLWQEQQNEIAVYDKRGEDLGKAISKAYQDKNNMLIDSLSALSGRLFQEREAKTISFIKRHPHSFTACYLAGNLFIYTFPDLEGLRALLDSTAYAGTDSYQRFLNMYRKTKSHWLQGTPAPRFVTHDLKGKEVKLEDFKGQYVLLDFWASWCRPCRKRAAELKAVYGQLQARGISVCGISMDDKKAQWEAATREDGIVWTNTCELKPFKGNSIASSYKVTQLPTLFLVDPDGKVISQNPSIEELLKLPLKKSR